MSVPITVAIPVGPHPSNTRWLDECLASIEAQTIQPAEILLIDDGANLDQAAVPLNVRIYKAPWKLGVAHAFNFGVALAQTDLVLMLGSDDKLLPNCLDKCWAAWQRIKDIHGYYFCGVRYMDGRPDQNLPCNAAMVHKELWNLTGGFPIEGSVGACDTMLISMMMAAEGKLGSLYSVSDEPLYLYRVHPESDTELRRGEWHGIVATIRNILTARAQ
jgi:glycosyltransferase involved in cell wall biosynthesis